MGIIGVIGILGLTGIVGCMGVKGFRDSGSGFRRFQGAWGFRGSGAD